jgi:hypothetical protein
MENTYVLNYEMWSYKPYFTVSCVLISFFGKKYSRLHTIKLQDSGTLRRWFLIDLLKHRMNECVDNIPYELRFLVRQTCGASNEKYC